MSIQEPTVQRQFNFTVNWFNSVVTLWKHLQAMVYSADKCLEIGSFEGQSACWTLQNLLSEAGKLYCIDTWEGSPGFPEKLIAEGYDRFQSNIAIAKGPWQTVIPMRMKSVDGLISLLAEGHQNSFDWIYIDGSHAAPDVLMDACFAWPLLKPGGLMIFDDYLYGLGSHLEERPKVSIDAFAAIFTEQLELLAVGNQVVVRKKAL